MDERRFERPEQVGRQTICRPGVVRGHPAAPPHVRPLHAVPAVVACHVRANEVPMPPRIVPGQAVQCALALLRETIE